VIFYLTPSVPTDCCCEGVQQRRIGAPADFDMVPGGASGFWEDQLPCDMISVRLAPGLVASTAEALSLPKDLAPRIGARDPLVEQIEAEQRWDVIPGAENQESFAARVATGIERVLEETGPGATAAVFVHGGVIGELISAATGARPLAFLFSDNTSVNELVRLRGDRWMLRSFNDTAHLDIEG